jgi:hypothetical protein
VDADLHNQSAHMNVGIQVVFLICGFVLGSITTGFIFLKFKPTRLFIKPSVARTEVTSENFFRVPDQTTELASKTILDPEIRDASSSVDADQLLLAIVDLWDEFNEVPTDGPSTNDVLSLIKERLATQIEINGGEIIRGSTWEPSKQRAIGPPQSNLGNVVVSTKKSGLIVHGRLVRKQEVLLS